MNLSFPNLLWIILIVWVLLGVIWVDRLRLLAIYLKRILTKPIISVEDKNPENVPFYPRKFLEDIANGLRSTFGKLLGFFISFLFDFVYRIIYVVISISLHFIITPLIIFRSLLIPPSAMSIKEDKSKKEKKYSFKLSVAFPKSLSKRYPSPFKVVVYPLAKQENLEKVIVYDNKKTSVLVHPDVLKLRAGVYVVVNLTSQEIVFSENVTKKLTNGFNVIEFTGKPKDTSYQGMHWVKLSITNKETDHEYISQLFEVKVDDFLFDHISRPFVHGLISLIGGLSSLIAYILTSLGQIDQVFGLTSGTAAAAVSAFALWRLYIVYRHAKETISIIRQP